jgi:hypothetical protein
MEKGVLLDDKPVFERFEFSTEDCPAQKTEGVAVGV